VLKKNEPIFASWFSGILRIPRGELLCYIHMGFGSVYERELLIKIVKGEVSRIKLISNKGKDINQVMLILSNLPGFESIFKGNDI